MFAVSFDELHNEVEWTGYDCVDQRPVAGEERRAKTQKVKMKDRTLKTGEGRETGVDCKIVRL